MAKYPALPLWTDAYLGDTTHLTTLQHGAFLLLLFAMWRSKDCRLRDDDVFLARVTGLRVDHWQKHRPVLERLNTIEDGWWSNARLLDERKYIHETAAKRSIAGKVSALKRLHRDATPVEQVLNKCAAPTPTPTTEVPIGPSVVTAAVPAAAAKQGTRWGANAIVPAGWITDADIARERNELPAIDLRLEAERFANFWASKSGKDATKLDWHRTWINWALNAKGSQYGQTRKLSAHDKFVAGAAAAAERLARAAEQGDDNAEGSGPVPPRRSLPPA